MFELKFVWSCNTYGQQPIVVKQAPQLSKTMKKELEDSVDAKLGCSKLTSGSSDGSSGPHDLGTSLICSMHRDIIK